MDALSNKSLVLKEGSVKEPNMYLGAIVKKHYIEGSDDLSKPRWATYSHFNIPMQLLLGLQLARVFYG
jgi:hypothetical protein